MTDVGSRIARLREALADEGVDAAVVSHPANRGYLSGFIVDDHGPDEPVGMLVVERDRVRFFTSVVNIDWAAAAIAEGIEAVDWGRPWPRELGKSLKGAGLAKIGIEDEALTVAALAGIVEGLEGAAEIVYLGRMVDLLRSQKDEAELAIIAEAIWITDAAFVAATSGLEAGTTEKQLAAKLDQAMRDLGADGPGFATIVAAGPHAARPHHDPNDRPIAEGEPVVIDMGARLHGYNADLTRTIWVGQATDRLRAVYTIVLEANAAVASGLRAGMSGNDADALARDPIEAAGYGDHFTHSTGHGLGIKVHEAPSLRKEGEDELKLGHVVTIEPGIYLPDWGGVRVEDVAVIEETGARVLTGAPKMAP
ncbi:MAG TPA: aminopeptidase P family protein [Thermomicrobiales bacterium]|nr:aminopeptidase P family protein [Thermomicrobiales bacterium]